MLNVKAETNDSISLSLEQQESSDCEKVRYILTISNVDSLADISSISINLFLYKYNSGAKKTSDTITKVYEAVTGTKGKVDNTYYAVYTVENVKTYFDGYTLTANMEVTSIASGKFISNEISYTINEESTNDKIISMDASAVPSLEAAGVKYYDFDGNEEDVFRILADNGFNYIRVRVWNDPYYTDDLGNKFGYGGGNCDLENCLAIGRRANKYGMKLLVDFQYSDFWADPGQQILPKAWAGYSDSQIESAIYNYTKESLNYLLDNGIEVGMVQVGNETNDTMCGHSGDSTMEAICGFFNAGSSAVREVYPNALVAVHFANPSNVSTYNWYAQQLNTYNVDYDVFGSSYYPYWHGTKENMASLLSNIGKTYNKKIMLLETSYANCELDGPEVRSDGYGNTIWTKAYTEEEFPSVCDLDYEFTVEGQKNQMLDLFETVFTDIYNGIGVSYWEGCWISVNRSEATNVDTKVLENEPYWEEYGCGWASKYAYYYNSTNYKLENGGCVIENEAFFDETGHPFDSLTAFKTIRDTDYAAASLNTTGVKNGYFETLDDEGYSDFSYFDINMTSGGIYQSKTDAYYSSSHSLNFYGEAANTCNFTIEQNVSGISGEYNFYGYLMGGAYTNSTIKAYATINGVTTYGDNVYMTGWSTDASDWVKASISFDCEATDTVIIGISVNCPDAGAWGYLDNLTLVSKETSFTNALDNGDFEADYAASGWTFDSSIIGEYPVGDDGVNSTHALKWYKESTINFDITQDVSGNQGEFTFTMDIRGGSTDTAYVYVLVNGVEVSRSTNASFTTWNVFETLSVTFNVNSTDTVVVGLHVESNTSGTWGYADLATLTLNS